MKQFLDHFTTLQQMDAGAWIAAGAVATFIGLAIYAVVHLIVGFAAACESYQTLREGDDE